MFCTKCGSTVDDSALVCPSCGNALKQAQSDTGQNSISRAGSPPPKIFSNIWIVVLKIVIWLAFLLILVGGTYTMGEILRSNAIAFLISLVIATLFVAFPMVFLNMASDINEANYHLRNMDK
jgi:uncharacterized membrane protein YvbJ